MQKPNETNGVSKPLKTPDINQALREGLRPDFSQGEDWTKPAGEPAKEDSSWKERLSRTKKGTVKSLLSNVVRILQHDARMTGARSKPTNASASLPGAATAQNIFATKREAAASGLCAAPASTSIPSKQSANSCGRRPSLVINAVRSGGLKVVFSLRLLPNSLPAIKATPGKNPSRSGSKKSPTPPWAKSCAAA